MIIRRRKIDRIIRIIPNKNNKIIISKTTIINNKIIRIIVIINKKVRIITILIIKRNKIIISNVRIIIMTKTNNSIIKITNVKIIRKNSKRKITNNLNRVNKTANSTIIRNIIRKRINKLTIDITLIISSNYLSKKANNSTVQTVNKRRRLYTIKSSDMLKIRDEI